MDRRSFLVGSVAAGAAVLAARLAQGAPHADDHGVASGDPRPDSVVLWTRVPDSVSGGASSVTVLWEVSTSAEFATGATVASGQLTTGPGSDYTVRFRAAGLRAFTRYYYRFKTPSGWQSVVGRTLTAPAADADPAELRFAFVSCANRNGSYFNVMAAMAADDIHYVAHLGDNVYEGGLGYTARTLTDWRNLHKLWLTIPELKEVRRLFPWVHTWDDHEVFNNYAGGEMTADQRAVQTAAYQAFAEYMPLSPEIQPVTTGGVTELQIFRQIRFGRSFEFFATDGRQYRDGLVCGREILVSACDDLYDPERTMLGRPQTDWLKAALDESEARWKFVLNGTVMMAMKISNKLRPIFEKTMGDTLRETSEGLVINLDQWDGYPANRAELLGWVYDRGIKNVVVLTGDIHNCFAGQLKVDFTEQRGGRIAGVEIVTGSVTSDGAAETLMGYDATDLMFKMLQPANPHIDFVDGYYHVYTRVTVTPAELRATYVAVDTITSSTYEAFELATLIVPEGDPRVIVEG